MNAERQPEQGSTVQSGEVTLGFRAGLQGYDYIPLGIVVDTMHPWTEDEAQIRALKRDAELNLLREFAKDNSFPAQMMGGRLHVMNLMTLEWQPVILHEVTIIH